MTGADDMATLPYTSGTTGRPKGCVHLHGTMQTTIFATPMWGGANNPGNRVLSVLPLHHTFEFTCGSCGRHWKRHEDEFIIVAFALADHQGITGDDSTPITMDISHIENA